MYKKMKKFKENIMKYRVVSALSLLALCCYNFAQPAIDQLIVLASTMTSPPGFTHDEEIPEHKRYL